MTGSSGQTLNGLAVGVLLTSICVVSIVLFIFFHEHQIDNKEFEKSHQIVIEKLIRSSEHGNIFSQMKSPQNRIPPVIKENTAEYERLKREREGFYGGGGQDQPHLGGFILNDSKSYEAELWEYLIHTYQIESVLDVGCGMGYSTIFFANTLGYDHVRCIEGSHDALSHSLVPNITVQHDYTLGPYWFDGRTFDLAWSMEFLEHVQEKYMANYMSTFKTAKLLFVSASDQGGWSHVNVRQQQYWIEVFESYGFRYHEKLTMEAREYCPRFPLREGKYSYPLEKLSESVHGPNTFRQSYFWHTGMVFYNPLFDSRVFDRHGRPTAESIYPRNLSQFDELFYETLHSSP